eukprot:gene23451-31798_t
MTSMVPSQFTSDSESKTLQILKIASSVCAPGKFSDGIVKVPFAFTLSPIPGQILYETYRGIHISVAYTISVICDRGVLKKALKNEIEFIVEVATPTINPAMSISTPITFSISPSTLEHMSPNALSTIPDFKITGTLHKTKCLINEPFTGEFNVDVSVAAIRSVELQLVRVESVRCSDGRNTQEASEIMRIQIAEGNICRNLFIPIYMVFPRLYCCPTVENSSFKIDFEVNLLVTFLEGYAISENFPLELYREG